MEPKSTELLPTIIDAVKWLSGAIIAGAGWFAGRWALRRSRRQKREQLLRYLDGLPSESKAVLLEFHDKGVHTLRGAPYDSPIRLLISHGVLIHGPGGGTYDAVDSYLTIRHDVWGVMDEWVTRLGRMPESAKKTE